jgi:hypothetical protein
MGFRSGPSGGHPPSRTGAGQRRPWAVGAPLFSRRRLVTRSGPAWANATRKRGHLSERREGWSPQTRAPVVGATAPSTSHQAKTCGRGPPGWTPQAVNRRRRPVSQPTRLSAWLPTRTGRRLAGGMVRGRRARHVAGQAGMASGFVGVTGRRHVKCGPDAGAPEAVERGGLDLHPRRLPAPWAQRLRRGEACPTVQGLLEAGAHG